MPTSYSEFINLCNHYLVSKKSLCNFKVNTFCTFKSNSVGKYRAKKNKKQKKTWQILVTEDNEKMNPNGTSDQCLKFLTSKTDTYSSKKYFGSKLD